MQVSLAQKRFALIALLALSIIPFFLRLGSSSLWDANEAFYAETPREMLEAGDYINPTFNYKPRFNKPPLCYWVVAASYRLFGVSEAAERLPLALGALVMIATAFALGRVAHSFEAGLLAALALATVPRFLMFSRRIIIDVYIAMFMGLTLLFFLLAETYPTKRRLFLMLMYASIGFGILTKGPVAVLLPALAVLLYFAATRRLSRVRAMMLPLGAMLVAAIVLPWYLVIYAQHGWGYITTFLFQDNLSRYTQPIWGPRRGIFFYVPVLLGDLFPWSLVWFAMLFASALPAVKALARRLAYRPWQADASSGALQRAGELRLVLTPPVKLLLIWIAVIVIFYSLSRNKEDLYIAPVYTAVAALVGIGLARFFLAVGGADGEIVPLQPSVRWSIALLGVLTAVTGWVIFYLFGSQGTGYDLSGTFSVGVVAIIGGLSICAVAVLQKRFAAIITSALVFLALNWIFVVQTLPDFERYKPVRALCERIQQEAGEGARVGYYRVASPSMVFYLRRQIFEYYRPEEIIEAFAAPGEVYCILRAEEYEALRGSLPATARILASHPVFQVKLRTIFKTRAARSEANREELPHVVLIANK